MNLAVSASLAAVSASSAAGFNSLADTVSISISFVATCSPSRDSAGSYAIWGHSTLVSPLGEIVATSGHEETVVAEVDYSAILNTRESLPILK
ncbi:Nitrilase/cyanide hydratase and apolipoprotein N-acyltransferase family protein [Perilla frutescens var. hirtella]|nr:Nitrilase/cyanide hydratase and apolipoprotein N-acyltransferase family protein [Perilla frutescens var. frutescens]KAH6800690.1 Nitrilase/cyanide hydratase and apolipoprotein N-acyltransferase family protein [Perilla frutescens var. hirtella]